MTTDLTTSVPYNDERPLPLIIAEKWGFALQYHQRLDVPGEYVYALQDWAIGLVGSNGKPAMRDFKLSRASAHFEGNIFKLPYKATNKKTYQMDYVTSDILLLFATYTREFRHVTTWESLLNWQRSEVKSGHVYIVGLSQHPEYHKLGVALDLRSRIGSIRVHNPFGAYYVHTAFAKNYLQLESELHTMFEAKKISGEWFLMFHNDVEEAIQYLEENKIT